MITGRIFEIDKANVKHESGVTVLNDIPMWDSPVMIADYASVPQR